MAPVDVISIPSSSPPKPREANSPMRLPIPRFKPSPIGSKTSATHSPRTLQASPSASHRRSPLQSKGASLRQPQFRRPRDEKSAGSGGENEFEDIEEALDGARQKARVGSCSPSSSPGRQRFKFLSARQVLEREVGDGGNGLLGRIKNTEKDETRHGQQTETSSRRGFASPQEAQSIEMQIQKATEDESLKEIGGAYGYNAQITTESLTRPTVARVASGESVPKRQRTENEKEVTKSKRVVSKAPKKQPRTITTAAIDLSKGSEIDSRPGHTALGLLGHAANKPSATEPITATKGKKLRISKAKAEKAAKERVEKLRNKLLAPDVAQTRFTQQNFMFASSSQLVQEDNAVALEDVRRAIEASETNITEQMVDSVDETAKPRLWSVSARGKDDFVFTPEPWPEDTRKPIPPENNAAPPQPASDGANIDDVRSDPTTTSPHFQNVLKLPSMPTTSRQLLSTKSVTYRQYSIANSPLKTSASKSGKSSSKKATAEAPSKSATKSSTKKTTKANKDPNAPPKRRGRPPKNADPSVAEAFNTKKRRKASEPDDQCPNKSIAAQTEWPDIDDLETEQACVPVVKGKGRSKAKAKPTAKATTIDTPDVEIDDTEEIGATSAAAAAAAADSRADFADIDALSGLSDTNGAEVQETNGNTLNAVAKRALKRKEDARLLAARHAALFPKVTSAVLSQPRGPNRKQLSWHEKIVLYDPIVLEDLTAWLNDGPLKDWNREVKDREECAMEKIDEKSVQKWCESNSICCLWREGLRGGVKLAY